MDKQEYQEFLDEIKLSYYRRNYELVAAYADDIILKKLKDNQVLEMISDSYAKQGEYDKAADVLSLLYGRTGSKKHAYMLSEMLLAAGDIDGAVDYYDEFVKLAPKDNRRLILKYEIGKAGDIKTEDLIRVLEEYNRREKDDRWELELAKLYHEAGMTDKCVQTCDDITVWFSDGEYVKEALKLKSMHAALTNEQQIRYEELLTRAINGENGEDGADAYAVREEPGLDDAAERFASEYLGEEPDSGVDESTERYEPETAEGPAYGGMIFGRDISRDTAYAGPGYGTAADGEPSGDTGAGESENDELMKGTFGAKTHTSSIDDTRFIPIDLLRDKIRYPAADIRDMRADYEKQQDIDAAAAEKEPEDENGGAGAALEENTDGIGENAWTEPEIPEERADPSDDADREITSETASEESGPAAETGMTGEDETAAAKEDTEPVFGHTAYLKDGEPEEKPEDIGATQIFRMPKEKTAADIPSAPALDTTGSGKKSTEISLDELRKMLKPSQVRNGEFGFFFDMSQDPGDSGNSDDNEIDPGSLFNEAPADEPEQEDREEKEETITIKVSKSAASKLGMALLQLSPLASMVRKPDLESPETGAQVPENAVIDEVYGAKLSENVDASGFPILNGDDGQIDLNLDLLIEEEPDIEGQLTLDEMFAVYQENVRQDKEHIAQIEAERLKKIQDEVNASFVSSKMYDLDDDAIDMVNLDEKDLSGEKDIFLKTEETPEENGDAVNAAGPEETENETAGAEIPIRIRTYSVDESKTMDSGDAGAEDAVNAAEGEAEQAGPGTAADAAEFDAAEGAYSGAVQAEDDSAETSEPAAEEIAEEPEAVAENVYPDVVQAEDGSAETSEPAVEEISEEPEAVADDISDDGTGEEEKLSADPLSFTMNLKNSLAQIDFESDFEDIFTEFTGTGAEEETVSDIDSDEEGPEQAGEERVSGDEDIFAGFTGTDTGEPDDEEMQELDDLFEDIDSDLETFISGQLQAKTGEEEMSDAEKAIAAFLEGKLGNSESGEPEDGLNVSEEERDLDDVLNALFAEDSVPENNAGETGLPDSDAEETGLTGGDTEETGSSAEEKDLSDDDFDEEISDYSEYDNEEGRDLDSIKLPENNNRPADVTGERPEYQLSDTIREELSEFLLKDGMEEQFVKAVDTIAGRKIKGDTSGGNLIVAGDAKSGKTYLAVEVVKAVTEDTGVGTGKVATVQAEALNGKDISKVFAKINGNDLVIENVGYLEDETIRALESNIRNNTSDGMVIFEGNQIAIDNILRNFPELDELFESRIDLSELSIVEWAEVAKGYAEEKGYRLDDMAVLALHAKINENNIPTRRLGYESITKIVDEAVAKAEKRNVGKLFSAFSKKDEGELKELIEADFM